MNKDHKLESKIDAGPLLILKEELKIEELEKKISIEDRFIDLIVKNINKERWGQRFAINTRANKDQRLIISIGATLPYGSKQQEIAELKEVCGHAIVADKEVTGIVHEQLEEMDMDMAVQQGTIVKFFEYIYKGGFSLTINRKYNEEYGWNELELNLLNRSTRQFLSQDDNNLKVMCLLYDLENVYGSESGTEYHAENKDFDGRDYTLAHAIFKSSISPMTKLVGRFFEQALEKRLYAGQIPQVDYIFVNYKNCFSFNFEEMWEKEFRYNKQNIADALITTICVACGYNDTSAPGLFWIELPDEEIVFRAIKEAKEAGIKLDLNKIPEKLKRVCGEKDFSTTALMFAAKKTDIPVEKRINLITFLLKHGADPAQRDKDGHDALWYAENKGNTEVAEYLRKTMSFHYSSYQGPTSDLFGKKHSVVENNDQTPSVIQEAQPMSLR